MKTLGIDLGSNSLGWAIITDDEITDQGVVIFDEGINREKGKDSIETPAAVRRAKRMGRRLKFRRRCRKFKVLELLVNNGMCPLSIQELHQFRKTGIAPDNPKYREWLKSVPSNVDGHVNPYYARAMTADHVADPMLTGRAMYHLAQRRGFKSSRKDLKDEDVPQDQESSMVKAEIAGITAELEKRECTLGQYFYELNKLGIKIRKRHLGRVEHYQKEFDKIADVQGFTADFRSDLAHALFSQRPLRPQSFLAGKCPLETKKARCLMGHPLFEEFRMYAFLNTIKVNDGSGFRFLTQKERSILLPGFYKKAKSIKFSDLVKLLKPKKNGSKGQSVQLEFNYIGEKSVPTCRIAHSLNGIFEMPYNEWQHEVYTNGKKVIYDYQTIFDALVFFDDDKKLQDFAQIKLGLTPEQAVALSKIIIPDGYAQYSLSAIRRIVPFLKMGHELSMAVFLAKLPDILGTEIFQAHQSKLLQDIDTLVADYKQDKASATKDTRVLPLSTRLHSYLEDAWKLTPDKIDLLYHYSANTYPQLSDEQGILPPVDLGMLRNPLVQRSMTILRRLVNELRRTGKIDRETRVHIELARSVNDRNTRMAWETWQQNRAKERQDAIAALAPYTDSPSDDLIERYILSKEQKFECLYTGKQISIELLVKGDIYDIEHTVPRSRSGDNSLANRTICVSAFNRDIKKGMLPSELPNYEEIQVRLRPWYEKLHELENLKAKQKRIADQIPADAPERKAEARQKMLVTSIELNYWKKKLRYFEITADDLDDGFMNRQMVDTGIMTRHAVEFLRSAYPQTYPVNGVAVAWARKAWGLQSPDEKKERDDHTHHAIDAIVIAALDRERFRQICTAFRDNGTAAYHSADKSAFYARLLPLTDFRHKLYDAVEKIMVKSYVRHNELKQTWEKCTYLAKGLKKADGTIQHVVPSAGDTIRGQLHADTFYGKITDPVDHSQKIVVRKFINDEAAFPNLGAFEKIVDRAVAQKVREQVQAYVNQGKSFKEAINMPLWMKMPDENGNGGVPILKVRICANVSEPHTLKRQLMPSKQEYKNYYYVCSAKDSNFRVALYLQEKQKKKQQELQREIYVDNLLECSQAMKNPDFIPWEQRNDLGKFLGFIYPGKAVLIYENSPEELKNMSPDSLMKRLYIFSKIESRGRMTLRYHREARSAKQLSEVYKSGISKINFSVPENLLYVSKSVYLNHTLFEGIDFKFSMTGQITFL